MVQLVFFPFILAKRLLGLVFSLVGLATFCLACVALYQVPAVRVKVDRSTAIAGAYIPRPVQRRAIEIGQKMGFLETPPPPKSLMEKAWLISIALPQKIVENILGIGKKLGEAIFWLGQKAIGSTLENAIDCLAKIIVACLAIGLAYYFAPHLLARINPFRPLAP